MEVGSSETAAVLDVGGHSETGAAFACRWLSGRAREPFLLTHLPCLHVGAPSVSSLPPHPLSLTALSYNPNAAPLALTTPVVPALKAILI